MTSLLTDAPFGDKALVIFGALVAAIVALVLVLVVVSLVARSTGVSEQKGEDWLL